MVHGVQHKQTLVMHMYMHIFKQGRSKIETYLSSLLLQNLMRHALFILFLFLDSYLKILQKDNNYKKIFSVEELLPLVISVGFIIFYFEKHFL